VFGPKRDEVMGECRGLHSEELNDLHSSTDIIREIKPRRMGWSGHWHVLGRREEQTGF